MEGAEAIRASTVTPPVGRSRARADQMAASEAVRLLEEAFGADQSPEARLERLTTPEVTQALTTALRSVRPGELVRAAEAELEREAAIAEIEEHRAGTQSRVADLLGRVGQLSAKAIEATRSAVASLKAKLGAFLASPWQDQLKSVAAWVANNVAALVPLVVPVVASAKGLPVLPALLAGLAFSGSMIALDQSLGHKKRGLLPNLEKVVRPDYVPLARAASLGGSELGSTAGVSAQPGVELSAGPAGALMSNPWNSLLLGVAYLAALPKRVAVRRSAEEEKTGERPSFVQAVVDVVKSTQWREVGKQIGLAALFTVDSLLFFAAAQHGVASGSMLTWVAANVPLLGFYFYRSALSSDARVKAAAQQFTPEELASLKEAWSEVSRDGEALQELFGHLAGVQTLEGRERKVASGKVLEALERLKAEVEADPEWIPLLRSLEDGPGSEGQRLLRVLGAFDVPIGEKVPLDRAAMRRVALAGAAFALAAGALGFSATALGDTLGLSVFWVNAVVLAMANSLPEFSVSKRYFEQGRDVEAAQVTASANATNVGAGILGTLVYALRKMLGGG